MKRKPWQPTKGFSETDEVPQRDLQPDMITLENARETIYTQDALLSVKRSAFALYQHELTQINPLTHRHYTPRQALKNILRWMALQRKRGDMYQIQLTPTQQKILQMYVEGLSRRQIAYRLNKTERTIQFHCAEIRTRLGLNTLHQVVAVAVEYGLVAAPQLQK
jgi:DNA-binding NarL/FixJ family response regulator